MGHFQLKNPGHYKDFVKTRTRFLFVAVLGSVAPAQAGPVLVFTEPAAWQEAVVGTIVTEDFAAFPTGPVVALETTYGDLTLTVDRIWEPSSPGIAGGHKLLLNTFDPAHPSYPFVPGPTFNDLSFPNPITAFGAWFEQAGVTGTPAFDIGDFNLTFAGTVITISDLLRESNGTGFVGFVSPDAAAMIRFQNVARGNLVNDLVFVPSLSYSEVPEPATVVYLVGFIILACRKRSASTLPA